MAIRGSKSGQPIPQLTEAEQDRFWSYVLVDDDCWWWTGTNVGKGYGGFSYGPRRTNRCLLAHRVAYALTKGSIPPEMTVSHLCHNRRCVRPAHLIAEPIQKNLARSIAGEGHRDARLTEEQVLAIRHQWDQGTASIKEMAAHYGVAVPTISSVVQRRTWRYLVEGGVS